MRRLGKGRALLSDRRASQLPIGRVERSRPSGSPLKMSGLLGASLKMLTRDSYCNFSRYLEKSYKGQRELQDEDLKASSTLYVGNLSFYTTEEQIHELFSKCGDIRRIIMGLDKNKKTPCGFCFVEYYTRAEAEHAMRFISGTRLDDRVIRTDWDGGFTEGRQYGRGKSGGQIRDEYRKDYDEGRGGFGKNFQLLLGKLDGRQES